MHFTKGVMESRKVREFENFYIKSQGKSGKKIPLKNEVSRSTFWFAKLFSIKRIIGGVFFNVCLSCQL